MIERQIVAQKIKEKEIEEFVFSYFGKISCSHIMMQRTPLGEKISVYTSRPGLIVGKKGANIKKITDLLKTKFNMENPQLEVVEITNPFIDAASVARSLISGFDRFGPKRFKAMAYRALSDALKAGARGIEIVIGGRGVPGERAKSPSIMIPQYFSLPEDSPLFHPSLRLFQLPSVLHDRIFIKQKETPAQ